MLLKWCFMTKNLIGRGENAPQIVYEDEFLLAVNKPAGMPVHPTGSYSGDAGQQYCLPLSAAGPLR